jgi:hypothetical protein
MAAALDVDELAAGVRSLCERLVKAERERDAWKDSAARFSRSVDYYRDLLGAAAKQLGRDVFVSDDGSVQDEPLRAKVPEMVEALAKERDSLRAELAKVKAAAQGKGLDLEVKSQKCPHGYTMLVLCGFCTAQRDALSASEAGERKPRWDGLSHASECAGYVPGGGWKAELCNCGFNEEEFERNWRTRIAPAESPEDAWDRCCREWESCMRVALDRLGYTFQIRIRPTYVPPSKQAGEEALGDG